MELIIEDSWKEVLNSEFEKSYFQDLIAFVKQEYQIKTCFPKEELIFEAFNKTSFNTIKVVLLGQDPYHSEHQAHGLCFSVPNGVRFPPSLKNIFSELKDDVEVEKKSGNLSSWTNQGVLLLNATLTVRSGEAGSHQGKGWEIFTDEVIKTISDKLENVVFILWGNFAHKKSNLINSTKHFIIKEVHPSPLSAYRGFFGSKPFSKTNDFLNSKGIKAIDW